MFGHIQWVQGARNKNVPFSKGGKVLDTVIWFISNSGIVIKPQIGCGSAREEGKLFVPTDDYDCGLVLPSVGS